MRQLTLSFFAFSCFGIVMSSYASDSPSAAAHKTQSPSATEAQSVGGIPCGKVAELLGRLAAGEKLNREQIADILGVQLKSSEGFEKIPPKTPELLPKGVPPNSHQNIVGKIGAIEKQLGPDGAPLVAAMRERTKALFEGDSGKIVDYINAAIATNEGHLSPPVIQELIGMVKKTDPSQLAGMTEALTQTDAKLKQMITNVKPPHAQPTRHDAFMEVMQEQPELLKMLRDNACTEMGATECKKLGGADKLPLSDPRVQQYLEQMYACLSSAWH